MKNLLFFFLILISFSSTEAQIIFESSEMIIYSNGEKETINTNHKILINSDTTEVELFLGVSYSKEKILSLLTVFNEETHDVLVYNKENNELLILYVSNGNVYSIVLQSDMDNFIIFN